jgi:hypothetical protein
MSQHYAQLDANNFESFDNKNQNKVKPRTDAKEARSETGPREASPVGEMPSYPAPEARMRSSSSAVWPPAP